MAGRTKKAQISVYLEPDIMDMLAHYAAQRDQSMSLIAQAAIASFLSPDSAERQEAALARRLGQIDRRLARSSAISASRPRLSPPSSASGSPPPPRCQNLPPRPRGQRSPSATLLTPARSAGAWRRGLSCGRRSGRMFLNWRVTEAADRDAFSGIEYVCL